MYVLILLCDTAAVCKVVAIWIVIYATDHEYKFVVLSRENIQIIIFKPILQIW